MGVVVRTAVYAQSTPARLATFYYYGDVRISTLTPSNAPVNGGTEVEVRGTGFIRSGSSILCAFRTFDEQGFPAIAVTRAMYAIAIPVHTADQIQHIAAPHSSTAQLDHRTIDFMLFCFRWIDETAASRILCNVAPRIGSATLTNTNAAQALVAINGQQFNSNVRQDDACCECRVQLAVLTSSNTVHLLMFPLWPGCCVLLSETSQCMFNYPITWSGGGRHAGHGARERLLGWGGGGGRAAVPLERVGDARGVRE